MLASICGGPVGHLSHNSVIKPKLSPQSVLAAVSIQTKYTHREILFGAFVFFRVLNCWQETDFTLQKLDLITLSSFYAGVLATFELTLKKMQQTSYRETDNLQSSSSICSGREPLKKSQTFSTVRISFL